MNARALLALLVIGLLTSCTAGLAGERERRPITANPSALVAAEIAFSRLAQEEGQWTAFRETADKAAVMFVPDKVIARDWLRGRADPPAAAVWQPHSVFIACDGLTGAVTGAWQRPDGSVGYFTTVWQRDPRPARREDRDDAKWEWLLDHGDTLKVARAEPDFIATRTANCRGGVPTVTRADAVTATRIQGLSRDRTLVWGADVRPGGPRSVYVDLWNGTDYDRVIGDEVETPAS